MTDVEGRDVESYLWSGPTDGSGESSDEDAYAALVLAGDTFHFGGATVREGGAAADGSFCYGTGTETATDTEVADATVRDDALRHGVDTALASGDVGAEDT